MSYIRRKNSPFRAIILSFATFLGTILAANVAYAQPANSVLAYTHQVHEIRVTTPAFSATYHVLVTPPEAVDPSIPGYTIINSGNDGIFENEPEVIGSGSPLIAANEPEVIGDNEPEVIGDNEPEVIGDAVETVTTAFVPNREYWFLASSGPGGATEAEWLLELDRFGDDVVLLDRVRYLVDNEAYLGSTPGAGAWVGAAPVSAATSGWTLVTFDGMTGDGGATVAVNQVSMKVTTDVAGTPRIPVVFVSDLFETYAGGMTAPTSSYGGLTTPAMIILGLLDPVSPTVSIMPPSHPEGVRLSFRGTGGTSEGTPNATWFASNY